MLIIRKAFYAVVWFCVLVLLSAFLLVIFANALEALRNPDGSRQAVDLYRTFGPSHSLYVLLFCLVVSIGGSIMGLLPGTRPPKANPQKQKPPPTAAPALKEPTLAKAGAEFPHFDNAGYCPNCSARLEPRPAFCWNCQARFEAGSTWIPTRRPTGEFRQFAQPKPTPAPVPQTIATAKAALPPQEKEKREGFFKGMLKPLTSRGEALATVRDGTKALYFLAALSGAIGAFLVGLWMLVDAAVLALFSFLAARYHSRVAAALLILYSISALAMTVVNRFTHQPGGTNLILAFILLITSARLLYACMKLQGRFSSADSPGAA